MQKYNALKYIITQKFNPAKKFVSGNTILL